MNILFAHQIYKMLNFKSNEENGRNSAWENNVGLLHLKSMTIAYEKTVLNERVRVDQFMITNNDRYSSTESNFSMN